MGFFLNFKSMLLKPKVINITVPVGSTPITKSIHIEAGQVVKCALFTDGVPESQVNVKIESDGGDELHPFVTYKEYEPTNGNHFESRKDLNFQGNTDIKVTAQPLGGLGRPFSFQMIFYVKDNA
jgi:hypothetical protein